MSISIQGFGAILGLFFSFCNTCLATAFPEENIFMESQTEVVCMQQRQWLRETIAFCKKNCVLQGDDFSLQPD